MSHCPLARTLGSLDTLLDPLESPRLCTKVLLCCWLCSHLQVENALSSQSNFPPKCPPKILRGIKVKKSAINLYLLYTTPELFFCYGIARCISSTPLACPSMSFQSPFTPLFSVINTPAQQIRNRNKSACFLLVWPRDDTSLHISRLSNWPPSRA